MPSGFGREETVPGVELDGGDRPVGRFGRETTEAGPNVPLSGRHDIYWE